ncbi:MAG: ECF transporter S component [Anaerolineaceae bacterium]|nr:ECF transporter S component [Anaerolineaceae bacterium]
MAEKNKVRNLVITGLMGAIAVVLGWTHWGFIPWFGGVSLTIMHVPAIVAAVIVGPVSGFVVGLIFGIFSMFQAAVAPTGPADVWFTNPLLSVLPRLFIGPAAWLVWRALKRWEHLALLAAGTVGSLTNTVLVLGMIGLLGYLPWAPLGGIVLVNGLPEALASALITVAVGAAYWHIPIGKKHGADLSE